MWERKGDNFLNLLYCPFCSGKWFSTPSSSWDGIRGPIEPDGESLPTTFDELDVNNIIARSFSTLYLEAFFELTPANQADSGCKAQA